MHEAAGKLGAGAELLLGPYSAPFSSGSKTGQIRRYKNRTDHQSATALAPNACI